MKTLAKLILSLIGNAFALALADFLIQDFTVSSNFRDLIIAAAVLTLFQLILKPILTLLFGPLILLTFGLALLFINLSLIYFLDFFLNSITIQDNTLLTLLLVSLLVSFVHHLILLGTKK